MPDFRTNYIWFSYKTWNFSRNFCPIVSPEKLPHRNSTLAATPFYNFQGQPTFFENSLFIFETASLLALRDHLRDLYCHTQILILLHRLNVYHPVKKISRLLSSPNPRIMRVFVDPNLQRPPTGCLLGECFLIQWFISFLIYLLHSNIDGLLPKKAWPWTGTLACFPPFMK